jgi:methylated-DNA-[protein]-cysteine S-methyltransferase
MGTRGYTLFETAIGHCGIAWNAHGIVALHLPEPTPHETTARLLRRAGDAEKASPPTEVQHAIDAITALMSGDSVDLRAIPLDMEGIPPFHRKVYEFARGISPGETRSYGEIAKAVGSPGAARAVGQAMARNPYPIVVPCHRVLAAGGKSGGFTANGGIDTKRRMLAIERVPLNV